MGTDMLTSYILMFSLCGHAPQLHFENPKGFDSMKTSYVYIMCPWISKWVSLNSSIMGNENDVNGWLLGTFMDNLTFGVRPYLSPYTLL